MTAAIRGFFTSLSSIPKPIQSFLLRGLLILVIWKILYLGFLAFPRTLDRPLTNLVGNHSAWLLNQAFSSNTYTATEKLHVTNFEGELQIAPVSRIDKNGKKLLHIADGCNGLELFVLYVGFILAMPAPVKRKLLFIPIGLIIIHIVNILRCAGLCIMIESWKEQFDFAHHYVFKMMIYGIIFALWVKFSTAVHFQKEPAHDL